jgi:hypothetical protein
MSEIRFFALRDDILPVLEAVEHKSPLKYVRTGRFLTQQLETFSRGADIPDLGKAASESAITCESFLICDPALSITVRPVNQYDGVRSFHIDQLHNPDTITFSPGGLWTADVLLYGKFATVSASFSDYAKFLMNKFRYQVRKRFVPVQYGHVGLGAFRLLKAGKRLTIAEQSPRDCDLIVPVIN